ncbi:MAG: beta-lactamase family protein, partial [Gammaproteobacteria bacterium]|nr:beta-lactamase family protein [Gammaproteobacteria bacterium]
MRIVRHAMFWFGVWLFWSANALADEAADAGSPAQNFISQKLQEYKVPGMGAVVTSSERILDIAVVGNKHIDSDKPLVVDDPFHIGSVAKTLTGTIIAQLVEDEKLAWDTPVEELLPEVMETAREEFADITLANLLAHEAGLKPMEEDEELAEVPELSGDVIARRLQFSKWVLQ